MDENADRLERVRRARGEGDGDALAAYAQDWAGTPGASMVVVEVGVHLRDLQRPAEAERTLGLVAEGEAGHPFALYELAFGAVLQGRHEAALERLLTLLRARPDDVRANLLAARLHYALGDPSRAGMRLRAIRGEAFNAEPVKVAWEFGEYIGRFPRAATVAMAEAIEQGPRFLDAPSVAALIAAALSEKSGFSMVRMGDGEGAFLRGSQEDELSWRHLYAHNRRDRAGVWFDGEIDLEATGFTAEAAGVADVIRRADVVGVPYSSWVRHEYDILSMTGVSSLVNVLRFVTDDPLAAQVRLGRQTLHLDLSNHGAIAALLRGREEIGLISCHASLPDRLRVAFGIGEVEFHKLPGEKGFRGILGEEAVAGSHYPGVFREVMDRLDRPQHGRLFLVAGGLLGKLYCDRIKARGGVALDVGSLADRWAGLATRPGYDLADALPAA